MNLSKVNDPRHQKNLIMAGAVAGKGPHHPKYPSYKAAKAKLAELDALIVSKKKSFTVKGIPGFISASRLPALRKAAADRVAQLECEMMN